VNELALKMTLEEEDRVLEEFSRTKSPYKVARALGIPARRVWDIIDANKERIQSRPTRHGGFGRPELRIFTIGRRLASSSDRWDNTDPLIVDAREMYEAGTVDIATGRDGGWEILYAFPRVKKQPRPGYWSPRI
jgi:hypothetical protein